MLLATAHALQLITISQKSAWLRMSLVIFLATSSWVGLSSEANAVQKVTELISVTTTNGQGGAISQYGSVSDDGRFVVFQSLEPNLVSPPVPSGVSHVYLRDRWNGQTILVSKVSNGTPAGADSTSPCISGNGQYVAFQSYANLVAGDTNGLLDVFIYDRIQDLVTERLSVSSVGNEGNNVSGVSSISADGQLVAFESSATNLVAGDVNGAHDIFVRDRNLQVTTLVSVSSPNPTSMQGNAPSFDGMISANGQYVVFASAATNLVQSDGNGSRDIFIHELSTGITERASLDSADQESIGGDSNHPSVSSDGLHVAFTSLATNLVSPSTTVGRPHVFVRDLQAGSLGSGSTVLVSSRLDGLEGNGGSDGSSVSGHGRYVSFYSGASDLLPGSGDTNGFPDVFCRDRDPDGNGVFEPSLIANEIISVSTSGQQAQGLSAERRSGMSPDGRWIAFESDGDNLVTNSAPLPPGTRDVFVRDRDATGFTSLCDPGMDGVIACPCSNPPAGSGRGCDNFGAGPADSGTLTATGAAYLSEDTVVLHATGENNTSLTVFWTGTTLIAPPGVAHGAGVRCATGLDRLYTGSASGGAISRPGMGDESVSERSAAVGAPISAGETRYYFTIYRDPNAASPCGNPASTINLTNAGAITWNP